MGSIRVNGTEIGEFAVAEEMQFHPAPSASEAQRAAAEALVVRELLRQEAAAGGLGADDSAIEKLLDEAVVTPDPDEETCRRYYESNRKRFRSPDLLQAQHILIAAPPDDEAARDEAKRRAKALAREIAADPNCFGALARAHSACPSKDSDGHLGQIGRGSLVPEIETYFFALKAGETCPVPVPSRYGWHLIRVLDRVDGRDLPFESVRQRVADYLAEASWRRAFSHYVAVLGGRASIEGVAFRAANSRLVQ